MDGFIEGFTLGCSEGIDDTEGAEDTEGCAEGSVEAYTLDETAEIVLLSLSAPLIEFCEAASHAITSWLVHESPHSHFCFAVTSYVVTLSLPSSNLLFVVSLASILLPSTLSPHILVTTTCAPATPTSARLVFLASWKFFTHVRNPGRSSLFFRTIRTISYRAQFNYRC